MMPLKKKPLFFAVATAAAAALALSGCSGAGSSTGSGSSTSSISVVASATGNFTDNFNPFNTTGSALQPTDGVIYEPLFYYNIARAQAPVPELGTSFKWNASGTQLTVTTRQGVKWTDGQPFSADDVAFTLNLVSSNPALNTTGVKWTAKATNADTVVIDFPTTSFTLEPQILGNQAIVPEHIWKNIPNPTTVSNSSPVGTGPYELKSFNPQVYVLQRNPNYWGTGADSPKIDLVRYISLANNDADVTALQTGAADWASIFTPDLKSLVAQHKNMTYVDTPDATVALFACENASLGCTGPQTDVAVRQAIYYATDRGQLRTQAVGGFGEDGSPTLLVPTTDKADIVNPANLILPQTANVAKAKQILQAAGYKLDSSGYYAKDGKEIDLTLDVTAGFTDYDTDAVLLQGQLKAAGISISIHQESNSAVGQAQISGEYQLAIDSLNPGASMAPYFIYDNYLSTAATAKVGSPATANYSRFSDPVVDAAIKSIASTDDAEKQEAAYQTIQDVIATQLPYIPLYVNTNQTVFSTVNATGWPSANNLYAFPEPWKSWDNGIVLKTIRPVK